MTMRQGLSAHGGTDNMSIVTAYHQTIRKVITAFGSLFDNLTLVTFNNDHEEEKRVRIPITYAQKEKFINRLYADYDINRKIQVHLPAMSYELKGIAYAADRKVPITTKLTKRANQIHQRVSTPYDFNFELAIYTRNIEDVFQILEMILPYFNPDFNIVINDDPEFYDGRAFPVVLDNVRYSVEYEGGSESKTRVVMAALSFTCKANLYPPTMDYKRIREVIVDIKNLNRNTDIFLKLDPDGAGDYIEGERVYQGNIAELPDAYGQVVEFDRKNMILHLRNPDGTWIKNMIVHGAESMAHYDAVCACDTKPPLIGTILPEHNKTWVNINIKPDPENAEPDDDWDYDIKITEYE